MVTARLCYMCAGRQIRREEVQRNLGKPAFHLAPLRAIR